MEDIRPGVLGVIDAALKYFQSNNSHLSDSAKKHIGKKSQDEQQEIQEKKALLEMILSNLKELEEEKSKIESECLKVHSKKTQLLYYNHLYNNEIFFLQKKILEIEAGRR